MREQNCRNARQPANEHRRVLAAGFNFLVSFFFGLSIIVNILFS